MKMFLKRLWCSLVGCTVQPLDKVQFLKQMDEIRLHLRSVDDMAILQCVFCLRTYTWPNIREVPRVFL